ncbi:MAG: LysR family transcriptional regulator [Lachnospirales bacterium]
MKNKQLETFMVLAECGNFLLAAIELHTTVADVTDQILMLEYHYGFPLINRTISGMSLTRQGQEIYDDARRVKTNTENTENKRYNKIDDKNTVRVGISLFASFTYLLDVWNRALTKNIKVDYSVVHRDPDEFVADEPLKNLGVLYDMHEGVYMTKIFEGRCDFLELFKSNFCISVPMGHKLYELDKIDIQDLKNSTVTMLQRGYSKEIDEIYRILSEPSLNIKIIEIPQYDLSVYTECELNDSVLLTLDVLKNVYKPTRTIPFDLGLCMPFGLIYPKQHKKVIDPILKIAKKMIKEGYFEKYD